LDTTVKPTEREDVLRLLETVKDPELPVLSIIDLGIVRDVLRDETDDVWLIRITPTYSGCPAMDMIATQIRMTLYAAGLTAFRIETVLSPAWTTDWMNDDAKERLRAYGIAPPGRVAAMLEGHSETVACPRCGSEDTSCISEFGSTACKSLYRCESCREPFDHFKCH
jgi:ring-1,2-phenylacetyl-CoA epoxidase subunit PaaD